MLHSVSAIVARAAIAAEVHGYLLTDFKALDIAADFRDCPGCFLPAAPRPGRSSACRALRHWCPPGYVFGVYRMQLTAAYPAVGYLDLDAVGSHFRFGYILDFEFSCFISNRCFQGWLPPFRFLHVRLFIDLHTVTGGREPAPRRQSHINFLCLVPH